MMISPTESSGNGRLRAMIEPSVETRRAAASPMEAVVGPSPRSARSVTTMGHGAFGAIVTDPLTLMRGLQIALRDVQVASRETAIVDGQQDAEVAEQARQQALRRAERSARKAASFLDLSNVLAKVVKVAAVAAAGAAAIGTGGAAGALLLGGGALLLGGRQVSLAGAELGAWGETEAMWIGMGLELTGSVMMAGSGFLAGAASASGEVSALESGSRVVETMGRSLAAAGSVVAGGSRVFGALHEADEGRARIDSEVAENSMDRASTAVEEAVSELRLTLSSFSRVAAHLERARDAQQQARRAAIGSYV